MLDEAVAEVIKRLVSNKKFADLMRQKINMEVDTSALDQEISAYEKQLRQCYSNKDSIMLDLDSRQPGTTLEKEKLITEALNYFNMI